MDPLETVALDELEKFTYVSTLLSSEEKKQLRRVLLGNTDVFAWSHSDMAGIDPTLASHKLNIIATAKPSNYSDRGRQSFECRFYQRGEVS